MKQRSRQIFHVEDMTKTESCTLVPQKPTSKAQLQSNLSNANVKIYRVEDNGDKTLLYQEQTDSDGSFYEHKDELENDKFYIYEVSGGDVKGTIRAVSKGSWITKDFKVSLASEIAYIYLAKDLKYDFNATKVDNRLNEVAKTILTSDINGDGNINVDDLLVFDYQTNLNDINSSKFSSDKLKEIVSEIYQGDLSYADRIYSATIGHYNTNGIAHSVALSQDETKAFVTGDSTSFVILDITDSKNPSKIGQYKVASGNTRGIALSQDGTRAFVADYKNGLVVINITDPSNPSKVNLYNTNEAYGVTLSADETKAFVADYNNGLVIIDLELFTPISNNSSTK